MLAEGFHAFSTTSVLDDESIMFLSEAIFLYADITTAITLVIPLSLFLRLRLTVRSTVTFLIILPLHASGITIPSTSYLFLFFG